MFKEEPTYTRTDAIIDGLHPGDSGIPESCP